MTIDQEIINSFTDDYAFLSNFYAVSILYEDIEYPSVEHAYQAAKTLDPDARQMIRCARSPGVAKHMGYTMSLRESWDVIKVSIMRLLITRKFDSVAHLTLVDMLLKTGDVPLVEGNTWHDNFWGVCRCSRCRRSGANMLGCLLMQRRSELML